MAGYIIHLAVGEEYIQKHKSEIKNYNDFMDGIIFPDSVSDKSITHYGAKSSKTNLKKFLLENDIDSDYNKGYFLHLITDYIFYNKFLECFSKDIYNDYDILNKDIEEKFHVKVPEKVKNSVFYLEGETKILKLESIFKFISVVSDYDMSEIKRQVLNNNEYWNTWKSLPEI